MTDLLDLSDRILAGEPWPDGLHPMRPDHSLAEVSEAVAMVSSFANVSVVATDDGLVVIDTGSALLAPMVVEAIRGWQDHRFHTAVYTHGHIDHVCGTPVFDAANAAAGDRPLHVVAHEAVADRFDRYRLTAGYNEAVNRRQFRSLDLTWPTEFRPADQTYDTELVFTVGGTRFECHHARGETDDHTWVWVPDEKVLCTGDLVIWCTPNAGNPQKVQRYAIDWARALRRMAGLGAELLLPGHGLPIRGAEQVALVLGETAELLEHLHDETLALMNQGARLDEILHTVRAPAHLLDRPYLRPVYDEPEFIVRNVWRLYGGWYDGNPATLKPAPEAALAAEVASLAGGAGRLADRALALAEDGDLRLAGHLAEMAALAAPDDAGVHAVRAEVFGRRRREEMSLMARGVFGAAEHESRSRSGGEEASAPQPGAG